MIELAGALEDNLLAICWQFDGSRSDNAFKSFQAERRAVNHLVVIVCAVMSVVAFVTRFDYDLQMQESDRYNQLIIDTGEAREAVLGHPLYAKVVDVPSLREFMAHHVFAVWDFMSLLKSLQRRLTGMDLPWYPPASPDAARMVNEIVLAEESDERRPGVYCSHFEIYLSAMREVGASTTGIEFFLRTDFSLTSITTMTTIMTTIPDPCREFIRETFRFAELPAHKTAAAFLIGREDLVPEMFSRMLQHLLAADQLAIDSDFRFYLERHIEIDGGSHGPLARRLIETLCQNDSTAWQEVTETANEALWARKRLWDGIASRI